MPKLLLADDSPTTQKVVQLTFADEGIEVVVADDGDTALELYAHHHPDIVLADINIPGLNGYEVCEAIRKRPDNGSTPVILLAGSFEPFDVEQAHRVGANDYLTKPFASIRRLVATVTALLDTVVRQDAAAEETVEPNSVPPNSNEAQAQSAPAASRSPEQQPGPALPPEPDMYATDDIEHLINQSFVETVEMPHTVAERVMNEMATEKSHESDEPSASRDEAAFDDELIETSFANEPEQTFESAKETQSSESEQWPAPATEFATEETQISSSNGYVPTPAPDLHVEPRDDEFAPPQIEPESGEATEAAAHDHVNTADLSQAPTEEFQIDQSGDETYFEPTAEAVEHPLEAVDRSVEHPAESVAAPAEEQTGFEIVSSQTAEQEQEPSPSSTEPDQPDNNIAVDEASHPESSNDMSQQIEEHTPPSTPWDSVADPQPARFQMDDSNLLELPLSFGNRIAEPTAEREQEVSKTAAELAPALVDEIARVTASQISEELVREIAQRIVPKVVEEVMARHRSENEEQ